MRKITNPNNTFILFVPDNMPDTSVKNFKIQHNSLTYNAIRGLDKYQKVKTNHYEFRQNIILQKADCRHLYVNITTIATKKVNSKRNK